MSVRPGGPAGKAPGGGQPVKPPNLSNEPGGRWATIGMPLARASDFRGVFKQLLARLRPERARLVFVFMFAIVGVSLSVVGPRLLGRATDILVEGLLGGGGRSGIDFGRLHRTLLFALALYICSTSFQYVHAYILAGVIQRSMHRLRADVEDKINRLPLSYVDRASRGDLLSRVTNDIDNLAQTLQQTISQLLMNTFMLLGTVAMMLLISPLLAVVVIISVPLSIAFIRFITRRSKGRFIAQWQHTGELNALVEESLTGHAIVKSFGRAKDAEEVFRKTNDELFDASFNASFMSGSIQPATVFIGNLTFVAIAVVGGLRVASGAMTIGGIQAFIQYARQFSHPVQMLASMANLFQSGLASAERVFELLNADEQAPDPQTVSSNGNRNPGSLRGRVAFEHVSFSYDQSRPLIQDLSLVAEAGQTVAIVGPTGAGKTTLVNLIMRFYELDAGRITLDGRDIAKMPRSELRSNIGMVLQDTWLFEGTISENIAYGNPDATTEQILEAAKATYVDRFVHMLPHGYDTIVDDEGGAISTGEKQLITIARAFLSDPTILILDEATSSVDTRTEVLIQKAMTAIRSERTSFVIAHRLSTIRNADIILVMEDGQIVEQGHHTDLLIRDGAYAKLYNAQFAAAAVDLV